MSQASLSEWLNSPPESLVIGDGPYARALAFILGTVPLSPEALSAGPSESLGGSPRVFERLKRCFLVVPESMAVSEALRSHDVVWHWVESLSSVREMHELAFLFVCTQGSVSHFEESLAVGLAAPVCDFPGSGYAVWSAGGSLSELLALVAKVKPTDLQDHRAHRRGNVRRDALSRLYAAARNDVKVVDAKKVLEDVRSRFRDQEIHLDLFCQSPSHRNGNLFRAWLAAGATEGVTLDWWNQGKIGLREWLQDDMQKEAP